ncbi:MAG: hypothetical protein C7B44_00290 [Sulfobacillus thermosulfidooxidans]|nr:MAG: hypothetical protein C7B44_00290 [Sulfobacillus thermosulfidooxidans]
MHSFVHNSHFMEGFVHTAVDDSPWNLFYCNMHSSFMEQRGDVVKAYTHVLGGVSAALIVIRLPVPHPVTWMAASVVGSLLPDWDLPQSVVGRLIPWPAVSASRGRGRPPRLGRAFWPHPIWHRHQAHSVLGVAVVSILASLLLAMVATILPHARIAWPWVTWGLFCGGLSHLALDGFNDERQWWLWPLTKHGFRWPLHAGVRYIDHLTAGLLLFAIFILAAPMAHQWGIHGPWSR